MSRVGLIKILFGSKVWDEELENIAQRWANQSIEEHDVCRNVSKYIMI